MSLLPTTGSPPAVTHEQIEAWSKLADDVTASLTMGGEQGVDFLVNIMAEWCEAVDDVNAARQVCVDLAGRGLRHEAIGWHATGFFDIADRLDPDRPGWETWEPELRGRGIVTPRIDQELKELTNRIFEELETCDLAGQSLATRIADLRKNMLLRGHLGERLVILESIRELDPASAAWRDMISPIRRRRVDSVADEVRAAISARDYDRLAMLRAEVASQDWGDSLTAAVPAMLASAKGCEDARDLRSRLVESAGALVQLVADGRSSEVGTPSYERAVQLATGQRKQFAELRKALVEAMETACSTREGAEIVAELGVKEVARKLNEQVDEPSRWVEQQVDLARVRAAAADIEAVVMRLIEAAPSKVSDKETFERSLRDWRRKADDCLEKARAKAKRLPGGVPQSTSDVFQQLGDTRKHLESHLEMLRRRERMLLVWFLVGIGVFFFLVISAFVAALVFGRA